MPEELHNATAGYFEQLYNSTAGYFKQFVGLLKHRHDGKKGITIYIDYLAFDKTLQDREAYQFGVDGEDGERVVYGYDYLGWRFRKNGRPHPFLEGLSFPLSEKKLTLDEVIQDIKRRIASSGGKLTEVNVEIASGASRKLFARTLYPIHRRLEEELGSSVEVKVDFLEGALLELEEQEGKEVDPKERAYYDGKKGFYYEGYKKYLANLKNKASTVQEISTSAPEPNPTDNTTNMTTAVLGLLPISSTLSALVVQAIDSTVRAIGSNATETFNTTAVLNNTAADHKDEVSSYSLKQLTIMFCAGIAGLGISMVAMGKYLKRLKRNDRVAQSDDSRDPDPQSSYEMLDMEQEEQEEQQQQFLPPTVRVS